MNSYSPKLRARLTVETIREQLTINEIAGKHEIHPNQITQWKKRTLDEFLEIFSKTEKTRRELRII